MKGHAEQTPFAVEIDARAKVDEVVRPRRGCVVFESADASALLDDEPARGVVRSLLHRDR